MARAQRAPPKPECYCCMELGADLVTYCCFQGLCQLCANELAGSPEGAHPGGPATKPASSPHPKHCFCGQQYRGSQFLRTKPTPDSALAAKAADDVKEAQQHLDHERAKMEDWFIKASAAAAAGTWHLDVPLLDYYRAEVKAIALVQERLDRVGPKGPWASSGYYIKDLEDFVNIFGAVNTLRYRFKPPGHIMYHPHIVYETGVPGLQTGVLYCRRKVEGLPQPLSIQPHSFEEIMDHYAKHFYNDDSPLPSDNWNLTENIIEKFGDPYDGDNWDFSKLRANPAIDQTFINEYYELEDRVDRMEMGASHYWYTLSYAASAAAAQSDQEVYEIWWPDPDYLVEILSHPTRKLDVKFIDKYPTLEWDFNKLFANPNIKWQW